MATIDALAGLARARTKSTNPIGECLGQVYADYGSHPSIGPHAGQYPIAYNGWLYSQAQHPGDYNAPAGAPVYFGVSPTRKDKNKAAGDVGISMGTLNGVAIGWFTDVTPGKTGIMTLKARAIQTQRPYMGWTGDFLGYTLVNLGTVPSGGGTPIPVPVTSYEDEMKIIYNLTSGELALVGGSNGFESLGKADAYGSNLTALEQVYGPHVSLTDTYFNVNKAAALSTAVVSSGTTTVNNPPVDVAALATAITTAVLDGIKKLVFTLTGSGK